MRLFWLTLAFCLAPGWAFADPLPSWRDGEVKNDIVAFIEAVSEIGGAQYVAPSERIAVFDNDGTLWSEQPAYFQLLFAVDRVAKMAEADPAIATSPALKAAAAGDFPALLETGKKGLLEVVTLSHSGIDVEGYQAEVGLWLEETSPLKDRQTP